MSSYICEHGVLEDEITGPNQCPRCAQRLGCPECGSSELIVRVGIAYDFDGLEFGHMRCDGPEENVEPDSLVICDACEWTGAFKNLEPISSQGKEL